MSKYIIILVLLTLSLNSNILIILDNSNYLQTHSIFFQYLKNLQNKNNNLTIQYSFSQSNIPLTKYDQYLYDHIVIMCTSQKEITSKIKVKDLIKYFDQGGNLIILGDIDTSLSFRRLFYAFGVDLDIMGSQLKDHFNFHQQHNIVTSTNYQVLAPFFITKKKLPVLYRGVGLKPSNYDTYQLYNLLQAQSTTFSKNMQAGSVIRAGSQISMLMAVQGLNNARALLSGSIDIFSDEFVEKKEFNNRIIMQELSEWVFQVSGVIQVKGMEYHGQGVDHKQTLFNLGQKIYFKAEIQQYNKGKWTPYITDDMQVQFVMLDPWVRSNLTYSGIGYTTQFYAPQKEGIYQFKIIYKKPGYTFLKHSQRVTVRPYKHDEFQRHLYVATPYISSVFASMLGLFIFILTYLYHDSENKQKVKQKTL